MNGQVSWWRGKARCRPGIFGTLSFFTIYPAYSQTPKSISAKAFILLSADDSVVYAKNESEKLPPASTVKLMTAMVALDLLGPADDVNVSRYAGTKANIVKTTLTPSTENI